jgi:D-arabinose 1-dehydrogenase-like Zn-dependent alcohol dehydrogenase
MHRHLSHSVMKLPGWVAEIGQGVVGFKAGEAVAVVPLWGSCDALRAGNKRWPRSVNGGDR